MAKEKLEDLSIEQLMKRKKTVPIFLWIYAGLIAITIILIAIGILMYGKKLSGLTTSFVPGFVLLFFLLFMFNGKKKIMEEMARRNGE